MMKDDVILFNLPPEILQLSLVFHSGD
jgi:hypothetical protein